MEKRTFITLKTSEFAFTNNELTFVKKYLHGKYPSVMSHMIDATRLLMRAVQTAAKPNSKLIYYASRTHPEETDRYVVMEMLYDVTPDGSRALIGLERIEGKAKLTKPGNIPALRKIFAELSDLSLSTQYKNSMLLACGMIHHRAILQYIVEFLDCIKQEIIVYEYSFTLDPNDSPHVYLDLRHREVRSHHIRLRFDFFESSITRPDSVQTPELSDTTKGKE